MAIRLITNITNRLRNIRDKKERIDEGADQERKEVSLDLPDEEIVQLIDEDIRDAMPLYNEQKQRMNDNEDYYLGEQLDKKVFSYELPQDENILYRNVETVISIITAKRREPIVIPSQDTDESKSLRDKTQKHLTWKWSDDDMQIKFEDWVRHAQMSPIAVFKIRYDQSTDDYTVENKRPQQIVIDKDALNEDDAAFICELKQDKMSKVISMFPKAKSELQEAFGKEGGTRIRYLEYWTDELVVWKVGQILLEKKENPYWNWDDDKKNKQGKTQRERNLKKLRKRWQEQTKGEKLETILLNYFDKPKKPYVILSLKNLGGSIYGDTTDFEQGKILQDIVNRRKRQIDRHAQHALGRLAISNQFARISKEETKKISRNPNATIYLARGKASEGIQWIGPQPMSPVLFDDLRETKQALDNLIGTHGTIRGQQGQQETATGRVLLKEGDTGRIDLAVRRIDKKLERLYGWMLQMVKVFYTESHHIKLLGKEGAVEYLDYSSNDVEDGVEVKVKSELTADKATQRQQAMERLSTGTIDPLTMFEKLDETNPKELTRRLIYHQLDPKLYVQEFAIDENTPGAEANAAMKAKQEQEAILNGEDVPPFDKADEEHLKTHQEFMNNSDFKNQDVDVKQNFSNHLKAEIDVAKQQLQLRPRR